MQIRSVLVFWLIILLVALFQAPTAIAQVPLANPNLNLFSDGIINAMAADPVDGSVIVGGNFTTLNGLPRNGLAKVDANGSVDPTWNPGNFSPAYAIAVDSSGNVYVGGNFYAYAGNNQYIPNLAKISGAGSGAVDATWNPAPDDIVVGLALDGSGNVYAAGYFQNIGGQARSYIAKLSTTGTGAADATWNPAPDGYLYAVAVDSGGSVYVGGSFGTIGGQTRNYLAKLSGIGTGAADATWNPNPDNQVNVLAVDTADSIYASGYFANIGGQARSGLARLSSTGTGAADATWLPNVTATTNFGVMALAFDGAGNSYIGGYFSSVNGSARSGIAKLTSNGSVDSAWNAGSVVAATNCDSNPCAPINAIAITGSGLVVAGGTLDSVASQTRRGLAEFSAANATLQPAQDATLSGIVNAIAAQPGGGMIVGGDFQFAGTTPRANLLRLQSDGTLDPSWNPGANGGTVQSLAIDSAGNIYVAGYFSSIAGQNFYGLAKLTSAGVATSWNPNTSYGSIGRVALDNSGDLYVSGYFSNIGGQNRADIAKISTSTGLADPSWNPGLNGGASALAVDDTNGWVYAGGYFTQAGGQALHYMARFSTSGAGAVDPNWNPNPDSQVNTLTVDTTGAVFVGGYFQNIGGQVRGNIAKLTGANGSADATWNPTACGPFALTLDGSGALYANGCALSKLSTTGTGIDPVYSTWNPGNIDGNVFATALDASGNVYVGGQFTTVGSTSRTDLAALPPTAPPIPSTERDVLVALYNDTTGANWTNHTNWLGAVGTECTWFGVTCASGHVTQISLNNNNLVGTLPPITDLTQLTSFDIEQNPSLTGSIPSLTGLNKLTFFDVGYNQMTGYLPSLTGLNNLYLFGVASNNLSGNIPSLSELTSLIYFWVDHNNLSGTVPDLSSLANLKSFYINNNRINGTLPAAPPSLQASFSGLCPNPLTQTPAPAWDTATGVTPWYSGCTDEIFGNGFE